MKPDPEKLADMQNIILSQMRQQQEFLDHQQHKTKEQRKKTKKNKKKKQQICAGENKFSETAKDRYSFI